MRVVVKTAMEKEQTRERERSTRTIASRRIWTLEKFLWDPRAISVTVTVRLSIYALYAKVRVRL